MSLLVPVYSNQISVSGTGLKLAGAPVGAAGIIGGPLIIVTAKQPGAAGNAWKIRVQDPSATDQSLTHQLDQTNRTILISLATDHSGNITTTGTTFMAYVTTGAGTLLTKFFSFRCAGTISALLTDNTTYTAFTAGADPAVVWTYQQPTHMVMSITGANLRYRTDGNVPTTTVGNRVLQNTDLTWMDGRVDYSDMIANLYMVAESGTAVVDYTLYHQFSSASH